MKHDQTPYKFNNKNNYSKVLNAQQGSNDMPKWCILRYNNYKKKVNNEKEMIKDEKKYDTLGKLKQNYIYNKDLFISKPADKGLRADNKKMLLADLSYKNRNNQKDNISYNFDKNNLYNDNNPIPNKKYYKNNKADYNDYSYTNKEYYNLKANKLKPITIKIGGEWNPENIIYN